MKRIVNEYSVETGNAYADVITHVFYLSPNKCKVIARQFGQHNLDKVVLTIGNESFDIKPSVSTIITVANTILEEQATTVEKNQKIPKIIFQTTSTFPTELPESIKNLIDFNPDYEYRFFDDTKRRAFMKNTFSQQVLDAYDLLVPGAFKADLFRYGYLFIHGGCYFDDKIIARVSLSDIIKPEDDLILCKDTQEDSILNSIIFAEPRNFLFLKLLLAACEKILSGQANDMLDLTGPKLMYKIFKGHITEQNLRMEHRVLKEDYNYYKNFEILMSDQKDKVVFTKTTPEALQRFLTDPCHYRQLWNRGEILFRDKISLYNLSIYIYPHPYIDTFKFTLDSNELTVERADAFDMWHFNLRLKIVDEDTNVSTIHNVGVNRTIHLPNLRLKPNVSFSHEFLITDVKDQAVIFYDTSSLHGYNKKDSDVTILALTEHMRNTELGELKSDHIILFTGSDAIYHCKEKDERTKAIFIAETLLQQLKAYKTVKFCFHNTEFVIPQKHLQRLQENLKLLYKRPRIDLETFFRCYEDYDVGAVCNDLIQKNESIIQDLNDIIQKSGESLEGNIFYEHLSKDFVLNKDWDHKRWNMFYYSRLSVDIMEIGFNAGHSGLLYLLSNPYSHIQFFDLGYHTYSRSCFEYLNEKFPGRLNVVWGDSTQTIPRAFGSVFDFIHIDGGHSRYVAESDFYNSKPLAANNCLVIIDDTDGNVLDTFSQQLIRYKKFSQRELLFKTVYHMLGVYC